MINVLIVPADHAGLIVDDEILSMNGEALRDVIRYQILTDEPELDISIRRGGIDMDIYVQKQPGEPLGLEVHSAVLTKSAHVTIIANSALSISYRKE